jgi:predicted phage tail protein
MHHAHSQTRQPALTEVRLYGHLRARFGKSHRVAVRSAGEGVRALCATVPGFRQHLQRHSLPGYRVWLDREVVADAAQLQVPAGRLIRIVPLTAGAKNGGIGQILTGAALIGLSYFLPVTPLISGFTFSAASIATSIGISMVLGGVSQLIAGTPKSAAPAERANNAPSYAFNGAVNTTGQGNPVPILIGRLRVGSQVISTGISTAALA